MINNKKVWLIRNFVESAMEKINSRIRIKDAEIEVETKGTRDNCISNLRFKVISIKSRDTVLRIVHSGYDMNGNYYSNIKEETLPTKDVNELFYSIAQH